MEKIEIDGTFGQVVFSPLDRDGNADAAPKTKLADLAAEKNVVFPDDYSTFMKNLNGAKPSPRGVAYRYDDEGIDALTKLLGPEDEIITEPVATVRYLYGLDHPNSSLDLANMQSPVEEWGRKALFAIGGAAYGGMIVMDLAAGDMHGSIHFMHFKGIAELAEHSIDVPLGYIAPNFTAFQGMFFDIDTMHDQQLKDLLDNRKG